MAGWFTWGEFPSELCLSYEHDLLLVGLSYAMAAFASYCAFHLKHRTAAARSTGVRLAWLAAAGTADGRLTERFIGVANIASRDEAEVRKGYERVIRPRFADAMMIGTEHPVELRRVVSETWPTRAPGNAICRDMKTGYLAITKIAEGDHDVVRLMGLRGQDMPAPSAADVTVCASSSYYARR